MNFNPSTPYWIYMEAFVHDGWNLVMSGKSGNGYASGPPANPINSSSRMHYVWGPDIGSGCSGHESWQAAGGVGGLLFVNGATDAVRQFPLMDRMGNVTGYRRAVSGSPAVLDAVFEYDAFGREIRSTGPASNTMAFRFSTKATDVDTGLVYYGYRFYDPDRGRWPNRDPIGEVGGLNLYAMVGNDAVNELDVPGQITWSEFKLALSNPACAAIGKQIADNIRDRQSRRYGADPDNGVLNAIKHCAWMCTMAASRECNKCQTAAFGRAHEAVAGNTHSQMDIHNNNMGISFSKDGMGMGEC